MFWVVVFSLSFVSMYFLISSLISSVIWLFSSALFSPHVFVFFTVFFPVIDFQSHNVLVRKDAWYNFNFLKFSEALFVTQDVIYPGECSVRTWEESVICSFCMECLININYCYKYTTLQGVASVDNAFLKDSASELRNIKYVMITIDKTSFLMSVFVRFKRLEAQRKKNQW